MKLRQESKCEKKWILHDMTDDAARRAAEEISSALGVSRVLGGLLVARGYRTPEAARSFIGMESELLHNPFLMQDMERAVNRIRRAIRLHEKITIYGDYDVDGVTSVCTLYLYLRRRGADVDYYIPNRIGEGYGVSMSAVRALAEGGTRLILTVDTGVTAHAEVEYAKTLGIDFVITDHHECHDTLPDAAAIVNPHRPDCPYPFKELAGVGVVFKLLCAYEESETGDRRAVCVRRLCEEYSDLVAIGTIADVMPICDENRLIVAFGLQQIEASRRIGLLALMEAAQARPDGKDARAPRKTPKITSGYIGYTLAPRINAAGRVRSATRAVELFLSTDRAVAVSLAAELCEANRDRQNEENRITEEAYRQIEENPALAENPVIVLSADDWHHGVIGIVSSRITERYGLPSILVSFEGEGGGDSATDSDIGKGSGRSVKGMNLAEALFACRDTLVKFGGHELAAGLSVRRGDLPAFYEKINEYARTHLSADALIPTLEADCTLTFSDLTMELAEELRMLEPYGVGNPVPTFVLRGARVVEATPVSGGKHTRFVLGNGEKSLTAMCFSRSLSQLDLFVGDTVDVLFSLDINEYNGRRTVQLIVRDIRRPDEVRARRAAARTRFEEIMGGATFTAEEDVVPERADFAAVYTAISRCVRGGMDTLSLRALGARLPEISYLKLKVIIRIFEELHLLGIEETGEETYRFSIQFTGKKTDLEKSTWLHRLRSQRR